MADESQNFYTQKYQQNEKMANPQMLGFIHTLSSWTLLGQVCTQPVRNLTRRSFIFAFPVLLMRVSLLGGRSRFKLTITVVALSEYVEMNND